jgi:hypothetical protein
MTKLGCGKQRNFLIVIASTVIVPYYKGKNEQSQSQPRTFARTGDSCVFSGAS